MKLSSYLDQKLIFLNIEANSKEEVIKSMVSKIAKIDESIMRRKADVENSVLQREAEISTCMGKGIAIPHARIPDFNDVVVSIGVMRKPITCKTATKDNDQVKLFFMIIAGQTKNKSSYCRS